MQFKASHRYARMGSRKARLVVDLIRGRTVNQALDTLTNDNHRASFYVRKVLASAVANALQNPGVRASRLVVSRAYVNEGPLLQGRMRWRPGPMGRAMPFRRRTCHIHIEVQDPDVKPAAVEPPAEVETGPAAKKPAKKAEEKATEKTAEKTAEKKAAKAAPAKKEPAKKAPVKKAPAKKGPAKKATEEKAAAKETKKAAAKKMEKAAEKDPPKKADAKKKSDKAEDKE
ncbi:MAG: 50S ribosomal protein L22 [Planctomycetota bacterium]